MDVGTGTDAATQPSAVVPHAHRRRIGLARAIGARVRPEFGAQFKRLFANVTIAADGRRRRRDNLLADALADWATGARLEEGFISRAGQDWASLTGARHALSVWQTLALSARLLLRVGTDWALAVVGCCHVIASAAVPFAGFASRAALARPGR